MFVTHAMVPKSHHSPALRLSPLWQSGAVLQAGIPCPVQGWGSPGAKIQITLGSETVETVVRTDESWSVDMSPRQAGGPHEMRVRQGAEEISLEDLLFGEVWLASGQSNMHYALKDATGGGDMAAKADFPEIRFFRCVHNRSDQPKDRLEGVWERCTAENAGEFSAVAFAAARELHARLGVPVGIVQNAWGGSALECWLPEPAYRSDSRVEWSREKRRARLAADAASLPDYRKLFFDWYERTGVGREAWTPAEGFPACPHACGRPFVKGSLLRKDEDGVVWFEFSGRVPDGLRGRAMHLDLGAMDAQVDVWVNGEHRFHKDDLEPFFWLRPVEMEVPAGLVGEGALKIQVRCLFRYCAGNPAGMFGVTLRAVSDKTLHPLLGEWSRSDPRVSPPVPATVEGRPWRDQPVAWDLAQPCTMFNGLVAPLRFHRFRGVLWYQGESNCDNPDSYAGLLDVLRSAWRETLQSPLFFGVVQLAGYGDTRWPKPESGSARLRRAQQEAADADPQSGLVTALHLGEPKDIHPKDKLPIGLALARLLLEKVYGRQSGPWRQLRVLTVSRLEAGKVLVEFDAPLHSLSGGCLGFGLGDGCGRHLAASASRQSPFSFEVHDSGISRPTEVSLDWADCPPCDLRSEDGLPPCSFFLRIGDR